MDARVDRVTNLDVNHVLFQTSLRSLGDFDNTLDARRNLRGQLEASALLHADQALAALRGIDALLHSVQTDVAALQSCVQDMESQLARTKAAAGSLTEKTAQLKGAREDNNLKAHVAARFRLLFTLSAEERIALQSGPLDEAFFAAMARVHSVSGHAKLLVKSAAAQQVGLEVLDEMSELSDAAYDRMTRWVKDETHRLTAATPEPHRLLRTALGLLARERPALLRYCAEEVEHVRQQVVVTTFIRALTVGGEMGRPMDATLASDALRFVGDMLAWIHQMLASETELVSSIFGGSRDDVSRQVGSIASGVARPFASRMEEVTKSSTVDVVLAHQVRSLLQFYRVTLVPSLVPAQSALAVALHDWQAHLKALFTQLVDHAALDARAVHAVHPDLSAPAQLHRVAVMIARIAETMESSLLPAEERTPALLIEPLLVPLEDMTARLAATLEPESSAVFRVNCLTVVRDVLLPYSFAASPYVLRLNAAIADAEARVGDELKQRVK